MAVTIDGTNGLTFNNGSTQASAPALTLLATITPTAATTIQSLNLFTSAYSTYLIVYNNVQTTSNASTSVIDMRFAIAGAVDSSSNYYTLGYTGTTSGPITYTSLNFSASAMYTAYQGCSGQLWLTNTNDTTTSGIKYFSGSTAMPSGSGPVVMANGGGMFTGTGAITGFSMFLRNGVNFATQGSVRVYGVSN